MSIHAISWVLKNSEAKLGARLVLLVLADHAKDDGTSAWPSVETMCREARMSRRGVQDALRRLEEDRMIVRAGESKSGTTIYNLNLTAQNPRPGGASERDGGAHLSAAGGAADAPEPSLTVKNSNRQEDRARARIIPTAEEPIGFAEWLGYHSTKKLVAVPRAGTSTRSSLARMFAKLVGEGYELADFKAVTDYAAHDDFWRGKRLGFDWALRAQPFGERVALGRALIARKLEESNGVDWSKYDDAGEAA